MSEGLTLYQSLKKVALAYPDNTALFYMNNRISFKRFLNHIDVWASILQNDFNIKKGDSVLISLPNIPQTLILFYAINKIGAISNMVHPYTPFETMQRYYTEDHCKVAFLFDRRLNRDIKSYKQFDGHIVICNYESYLPIRTKSFVYMTAHRSYKRLSKNTTFSFYDRFKDNHQECVEYPLKDDELAVLLHSASTTGDSKTIMLGARSFNFTASKVPEVMCMSEEELLGKTMISLLPSFHGFGLCMTMHAPLVNGFSVALMPRFSTYQIARIMRKTKSVISICGVPSVFRALLLDGTFISSKYVKTLRSCFSGGDSLPTTIKENFDALMIKRGSSCRLFEGYGLTEALSVCAVNTHRHHKLGSVGYPLSDIEFKIIDQSNNECEVKQVGEICIKCKNNMLGYYKDEEGTKKAYWGEYLKTGDLGYVDEDGFIYFSGRKKRVIKVSGVAVFPNEIEELISHIPGVKGVCAIQIPDEKLIHAVKVFVVSDNHNPEIILEECRRHLISWAIPKEVEYVSKLPMTKFKKVNFQKLQEQENINRGISSN